VESLRQWFLRTSRTERVLVSALKNVYSGRIIVQARLARYHVDILLPEFWIVVEVDGPWHWTEEVSRSDSSKDAELRSLGYHVVRLPCEQVRANPEASALYVLEEMKRNNANCYASRTSQT